ncbi:MAG: glutamate--tRNA ligase, partial [Terriglobales bacterium]
DGLKWLGLGCDEYYRQSERLELHRNIAQTIFDKGLAYRDFSQRREDQDDAKPQGAAVYFNSEMRSLSREESDRRAAAGEPFALRYKVPRETERIVVLNDAVYGTQEKSTNDIEDFALLRSDGMPTYHLASCADDIDLRISHIIRGQDHVSNTFKHILIFEGAGASPPQFAHLPLLVAPDGTKLSKRKHGPVVSVTTYRDAGFLPEAFINFLCLLGWSPKDDRQFMTLDELTQAFALEGVNRANAVINFTEVGGPPLSGPGLAGQGGAFPESIFDPKALHLNAEHIRALPVPELAKRLFPVLHAAYPNATPEKAEQITPLIRERIKLLNDAVQVADFFFLDELPPYPVEEVIPQKGDLAMAKRALEKALQVLPPIEFKHDPLDQTLRAAAQELGLKAGQMFQPIRVAICGRKNAPPLFETMEVLGKAACLNRIEKALHNL